MISEPWIVERGRLTAYVELNANLFLYLSAFLVIHGTASMFVDIFYILETPFPYTSDRWIFRIEDLLVVVRQRVRQPIDAVDADYRVTSFELWIALFEILRGVVEVNQVGEVAAPSAGKLTASVLYYLLEVETRFWRVCCTVLCDFGCPGIILTLLVLMKRAVSTRGKLNIIRMAVGPERQLGDVFKLLVSIQGGV